MRSGSWRARGAWLAAAGVAVVASACAGKDRGAGTGMSDDLAKDVALAADGGLSLPQAGTGTAVVSAEERIPEARPRVARASRAARPVPHRHAALRERVAPAPAPAPTAEVAAATPAPSPAPEPAAAPAPASEPVTVASAPTSESGGDATVNEPQPADAPPPYGGSGEVVIRRRSGGGGLAGILGAIGSAVLRGGVVVGDDHCDPRATRRGHGGGIYINERGPVMRGPVY